MKTYTIVKKPEDMNWNLVPEAAIDCCQWGYWADVSAKAQVCYDAENLYVRLTAREENIRAEVQEQTGMPCQDSCLEFFFSPMEGDLTYLNFEMNPNCVLYLGIGTDRYNGIRLLLPEQLSLDARTERIADGWVLTYRIPASLLRRFFPAFTMAPGVKMRGNFYKCGDKTQTVHYFAWNPVQCEKPDFHRPEWFGEFVFA